MSAVDRALALLDLGRSEQALDVLASAPPDAATHLLRAQCLLALGRAADAQQQAQRGLSLEPGSEWGHRLLAYACLAQNRAAEASAAAQDAVTAAPNEHLPHVALSDCRRAESLHGLALQAAAEAVRLAPDRAESHTALSRAFKAAGQPDRAEAAARGALRIEPQDQDAAAALAEALESMLRLGEAQDVRLGPVRENPADSQNAGRLAGVVHVALLASMAINAVLPLLMLDDTLDTPGAALLVLSFLWLMVSAGFLLLRWAVQRSLAANERRGLTPYRRGQERLLLAGLSFPLLVLTGAATWAAGQGGGSWWLATATAAGAFAAYWFGTWGRDRRGGWTGASQALLLIGRELRPGRLRAARTTAQRSRELLKQVVPADESDEVKEPVATYLRNANYLIRLIALLWCAGVALLWLPIVPAWVVAVAVLAAAALDASFTDNTWPRYARRSQVLWKIDGNHLRVVDRDTGRAPGLARSALRGVLRLLLAPYLLVLGIRHRTRVWVGPHDRLTRTQVVRVLRRVEAERSSGSASDVSGLVPSLGD